MKKLSIMFLVAAMVFGLTSLSFAQLRKDMNVMKAKIVRVMGKNEIVVMENGSNKESTFFVKKGVDASWAAGTVISFIYKTGSNVANSVRVVQAVAVVPSSTAVKVKKY